MSEIETLRFKLDDVPTPVKTSVNARCIKSDLDRTVLRPIDCRRILSVSASDRDQAKVLLESRNVLECSIEKRNSWRWRHEVHIFPSQGNSVKVRGRQTYQHFLLGGQDSTIIEANGVQAKLTPSDNNFELDIREDNYSFEGWTFIEGLYETNDSRNRCLVFGFSEEIKDFDIV